MNAKKKMIISISACVMVVLAAVVAVVAVLAAQTVTMQSSINISYSSAEFKGSIDAYYKVGASAATSSSGANKIGTTVTFDGSEPEGTEKSANKTDGTVSLSKTDKYISFIFEFNSTQDGYEATLTTEPSVSGFTVTYSGITSSNKTIALANGSKTTAIITYELTNFKDNINSQEMTFKWTISK